MSRGLSVFVLFYAAVFMGNAVFSTFLPVYLRDTGFTQAQIGVLLSVGPFVAMLGQPVWGTVSDRAVTKNRVLLTLLAGCGAAALLMPLSDAFAYLLILLCAFAFFQTSVSSISDTITFEQLDKNRTWSYGPIRMGGTIGFAVMAVAYGAWAKDGVGTMFAVFALCMAAAILLLLRFPAVPGHQSGGRKMNITVLFRNRRLMVYMGISFILQIALGYYYTFYPIYFKELGGGNDLLGWSMLISSVSEIPFLLFSGVLLRKIPIPVIFMVAGIASASRWLLFSVIDVPFWTLPVQALHGLMFIVLTVTMATIIHREVPAELKASGQTLNGLLSFGAARIIGSFAGGFANDSFGIRRVFLFNSFVSAGVVVLIGVTALLWERRRLRG